MENQKPKIDISGAPWAECCGGPQFFEITYMFKRISAIISPSGKEEYLPIEMVVCKKCGKVPAWAWSRYPDLPEELKSQEKTILTSSGDLFSHK